MSCDDDLVQCPKCDNQHLNKSHPCPFAQDVRNDRDFRCDCCNECRHECAMDI